MAHCTNGRHTAMFLAGIAADQTASHWWIGTLGRDLLPMQVGPITFTPMLNIGLMVAWPVVLAALVWYAWFRKDERTVATSP